MLDDKWQTEGLALQYFYYSDDDWNRNSTGTGMVLESLWIIREYYEDLNASVIQKDLFILSWEDLGHHLIVIWEDIIVIQFF